MGSGDNLWEQIGVSVYPTAGKQTRKMHLDTKKSQVLSQEVENLAAKEATHLADKREGYTSLMFLVPKSDGSWHPVIDLNSLNRYVTTHYFKIESIRTVKRLKQGGDWLIKLVTYSFYIQAEKRDKYHS